MSAQDYLFNLAVQQFAQQLYAANLLLAQNPEQLYRHHNVLPALQNPFPHELYSVPAQAAVQAPLPVVQESPGTAPQPVRLFRGEIEVSQKGVHPVIIYDIPGSEQCYVFQYHKKTIRDDTLIYRCSGCRHQNEKFTSIHITGDIFHMDPCQLPHNCLPLDRYDDKADRVTYQSCQNLRKDKTAHSIPPRRHHADTEQSILTMDWRTREERRKVPRKFSGKGYDDRRRPFARAASAQKRTVQMDSIPEDLSQLPDGENFLQLQTSDIHIYYSEEVIAMARDNGLSALIGDGIHKLNPITIPDRMDKGQLYTIHAVVRGGVEITILYAITRHKNIATYTTIFRRLREIIGERPGLRIVLDFEKAAIRAARETFEEASVEGCAFHLAQAWNRMSKELGLRRFVRGAKRVRAVARWWEILKGIVFLPEELVERVPALRSPPVNANHVAHEPCNNFLKYLDKTWFNGTYKGMWCKWDVDIFRTTNAAEAFHSKLRGMLSRRNNPPFDELLECSTQMHWEDCSIYKRASITLCRSGEEIDFTVKKLGMRWRSLRMKNDARKQHKSRCN